MIRVDVLNLLGREHMPLVGKFACVMLFLSASAAASAQIGHSAVALPVPPTNGSAGSLPNVAAAQLVPVSGRPDPAAAATAHMKTPEESQIAPLTIGTAVPNATNLPNPQPLGAAQ